jgi:spore germination protein GerM
MSVSTVEKDPAKFAIAIQQLFAGRSDANGAVTLTTGTTTVVSAPNVAAQSAVFLSARSASAAAALAGAFISSVGKQTFTITHAAGAADRSFFWVALG